MRIVEIDNYEQVVRFDNGWFMDSYHCQDCCEYNYADFEQIDDLARAYDFDPESMQMYPVEDSGFTFGDGRRLFFVPCYSEQNGYYSSDIDISLCNDKGETVLGCTLLAETVLY